MKRFAMPGLVGLLVVAVVAVGTFFGVKQYRAEASAKQLCQQFTEQVAALPDPAGEGPTVLGDSYTAGFGLQDPSHGYAFALHPGAIDAFPGSGFVDESPCGAQSFARRLLELPAGGELLIIQGGLNDSDEKGVEAAAIEALHIAKMKASKVVLVGPPTVPAKTPEELAAVDTAYANAAANVGVKYVPALGWKLEVSGDGLHLTEAGHRQFAARLAPLVGASL